MPSLASLIREKLRNREGVRLESGVFFLTLSVITSPALLFLDPSSLIWKFLLGLFITSLVCGVLCLIPCITVVIVRENDVSVDEIFRVREEDGAVKLFFGGRVRPKTVIDCGRILVLIEHGEMTPLEQFVGRIPERSRRYDLVEKLGVAMAGAWVLSLLILVPLLGELGLALWGAITLAFCPIAHAIEKLEKRELERGFEVYVVSGPKVYGEINPKVRVRENSVIVGGVSVARDSICIISGRKLVVVDKNWVKRVVTL